MSTIQSVCDFLEQFAPTALAEDWDNVGLILGDADRPASRIMTCLTITPESAAEAIEKKADLIVAHHPLPFSATKRITTAQTPTRLVWELARAGVSIYSPHTAFDSALGGINQMLCGRLGLSDTKPVVPNRNDPQLPGTGRIGKLPQSVSLESLAEQVKTEFRLPRLQVVGDFSQELQSVATACGSGGSFLAKAARRGAECLVTGEATFHTVLEARALGVGLILMGHYFSERFAIEELANKLDAAFSDAQVWASVCESDPIQSL